MKRVVHFPLLAVGATLILAPLVFHSAITILRMDQERIDDFYRQHSRTNVVLPKSPGPTDNSGYEWACFGVGVGLAFASIRQPSEAAAERPEKWTTTEL